MARRCRLRLLCLAVALCLSGCASPVKEQVDALVCELSARPLDLTPPALTTGAEPVPPPRETAPAGRSQPGSSTGGQGTPAAPSAFQQRLRLPEGLPGAREEFRLPPRTAPADVRKQALRNLFPPLPTVEEAPRPQPGLYGHPLTLPELQQLAMSNSPQIAQAAADVRAAEGAARQAGAYPNPNVGYQGDQMGSGGFAGQQGFFVEQTIKTAGKLKTAEAVALMDLQNARLALRRAQLDVMSQVRAGYFAVLVARHNLDVTARLRRHTDTFYQVFVDYAVEGLKPTYQPLELRALAVQLRTTHGMVRQRYETAWKQLAAAVGLADLPFMELAGNAEMSVPLFDRAAALARVRTEHTDVLTARTTLQRARYNLHLAEITPYPDVDFRVAIQHDFAARPSGQASTQIGIPIPVWDQNRGGIKQAQALLVRANEEEHRVRTDLTARLAEAFERYENNRRLAQEYRERVLSDLKQVFHLSLSLFEVQSERGEYNLQFLDLVTNQQLYVTAVTTYEATLRDLWQAAVDVAALMQVDDFFQTTEPAHPRLLEELDHPPGYPCAHPCSPLANPGEPACSGGTGISACAGPAQAEMPVSPNRTSGR